jgi:membrane fusion protein (multidrug efflux system)
MTFMYTGKHKMHRPDDAVVVASRERHAWRAMVMAGFALVLAACGDQSSPAPAAPAAVAVSAYTVESKSVPLAKELNGRVVAAVTAEIRPQIGGIVRKRLFTEGSAVKAGQVLYEIDPTSAETAVIDAQATLASAKVALASARAKAARYRKLVQIEAVSLESAEEAEAAYKQAVSAVVSAEASLKSATISLGYASVTSPINGLIGRSSVSQGALVTANQTTALATVQQLDPIYVDATQSAADILRVRRGFAEGKVKVEDGRAVVRLMLDENTPYEYTGQLQLADAIVDETTGTVTVRAQFPNPKGELLPGMYGQIRIEGAVMQDALVVPQVAITRDTKGNALAYVINADNTVEQRTLTTHQAIGDQWIVEDGLRAGDRVVVEGLQKIRAGSMVQVTGEASAATSNPTSAAPAASN